MFADVAPWETFTAAIATALIALGGVIWQGRKTRRVNTEEHNGTAQKLDRLDGKLDRTDQKLDRYGAKIDSLDDKVDRHLDWHRDRHLRSVEEEGA